MTVDFGNNSFKSLIVQILELHGVTSIHKVSFALNLIQVL